MPWLQIQLATDASRAPALETALEEAGAVSVTMLDAKDQPLYEPGPGETPLWQDVVITGLFTGDCGEDAVLMSLATAWLPETLPPHRFERLEDQAWERAWMDDFKPIRFGERLWICPSWAEAPDPDAINILLDPGLAFGTGTHPTTALCLEWLDGHAPVGSTVIDYGCGSGILGIAALLLGAEQAIGVDTDPQALSATLDNCSKNGVGADRFPVYLPDDFHALHGRPVDAVLANILAGPLTALAPTLAALVRPGGNLVLSGILRDQAEDVLAAYAPWFEMDEPASREDWVRLSGRRKSAPDAVNSTA